MIKNEESLLCFLICFTGIGKVKKHFMSSVVCKCSIWCSMWHILCVVKDRAVFLLWQSKCPSYGILNRFENIRGAIYESLWLVLLAKHFPWFYRRLSSRQYLWTEIWYCLGKFICCYWSSFAQDGTGFIILNIIVPTWDSKLC